MEEVMKMLDTAAHFCLEGTPVSCEPYGSGHINVTYLLKTDKKNYILQKINDSIFKDVDGLMNNITAVTGWLAKEAKDEREVLHVIPTVDGRPYLRTPEGCYRVYDFVTGSLCMDAAETEEDFYQSAYAFGTFQRQLAGFPAETLCETIPNFHNTVDRYRLFKEALKKDVCGRAAGCAPEIEFALKHEQEAGMMLDMLAKGLLPLRVTHNDTKLNNVLLDAQTRKPLCVIDLDTVMPGLAGNDFGDSIRFGANTAAEDEKDLSKVKFSVPLFTAYANGFLAACDTLNRDEIETLPLGAKLMTLECGVRFLTDYLSGDTYFRIHRPEHNLDRTRTQFRLIEEMEAHWQEMMDAVHRAAEA